VKVSCVSLPQASCAKNLSGNRWSARACKGVRCAWGQWQCVCSERCACVRVRLGGARRQVGVAWRRRHSAVPALHASSQIERQRPRCLLGSDDYGESSTARQTARVRVDVLPASVDAVAASRHIGYSQTTRARVQRGQRGRMVATPPRPNAANAHLDRRAEAVLSPLRQGEEMRRRAARRGQCKQALRWYRRYAAEGGRGKREVVRGGVC